MAACARKAGKMLLPERMATSYYLQIKRDSLPRDTLEILLYEMRAPETVVH
jgi:hypothetical protein